MVLRFLGVLLGVVLFVSLVSSNVLAVTWEKGYQYEIDTFVFSSEYTSDGGSIHAGAGDGWFAQPQAEQSILIKLDEMGSVEWQKIYPLNGRGVFTDVIETLDGGFIAIGPDYSDYSNGPRIIRVDKNGNVLWAKQLTGSGSVSNDKRRHIIKDGSNGYIIKLNDSAWGTRLVNIDGSGNILWQKSYDFTPVIGGFSNTSDGGFILATQLIPRYYNDGLDGSPAVVKLDSQGNIVWQKAYPSSLYTPGMPFYYRIEFQNIIQTTDGGYFAVGRNNSDTYLVKLDSSGNIILKKKIDTPSAATVSFAFPLKNGGAIYAWQYQTNNGYIMWIDPNGDVSSIKRVPFRTITISENEELLYQQPMDYIAASSRMTKTDSSGNFPECSYLTEFSPSYVLDFDLTTYDTTFTASVVNGGIFNLDTAPEDISDNFNESTLCASALPDIFVDSTFVDFGAVEYAEVFNQAILIANNGTAPLTIDNLSFANLGQNDFDFSTDCDSLLPNESCAVNLSYSPGSLGSKVDTLFVDSNDPDQPRIEIPISGSGVDTTLPVINLLGDATLTVEAGEFYSDAGVTAYDNYDGNLNTNLVIINPVNTSVSGAYIVTYNVSDSSGNQAIEVARTVNVVDTIPPEVNVDIQYVFSGSFKKAEEEAEYLVPLTIDGSAYDSGVGVASVVITVDDEYNVFDHAVYDFGQTVGIEYWRAGGDNDGRVYTITVVVTDNSGNVTSETAEILVLHDSGN